MGIASNRIPAVTRDATITLSRAALVEGDLAESARQLASALPLSERLGQSLASVALAVSTVF